MHKRKTTDIKDLKKFGRREFLKLLGTASALGAAGFTMPDLVEAALSDAGDRPNIIFILGDNHNAGDMGPAGHPFLKTPGLDQLAREGVTFDAAYNTTSLCSPSRASILTGNYAHNHEVKNNHTPWTGCRETFLKYLHDGGYATAFIGKWHMPGKGLPEFSYLDLFVSYTANEGQGRYFDCPMIVNGQEVPSRSPYITTELTDYAIEFIEEKRKKADGTRQPFCLYLSHRAAHPPFAAPEGFAGMYDEKNVDMPKEVDPLWFGKTRQNVFQGVMMGTYPNQYRKYCETITAMDHGIDRLLKRVDELDLHDNTVVIYMADNGIQWGQHGMHGIREPYQDSALLPFIVRAPWLVADPGTHRKQLALNIDIGPTLIDIAGLSVPGSMDGESLVPVMRNPKARGREAFLMEFWRYFPEPTPSYVGVVTKRYKYIEFERGRDPWLFDLEADPEELNNLYGTPEGAALLPKLKEKMHGLMAGRKY